MASVRLQNLPRPLKVGFSSLLVGLLFTWLSNLFIFSETRVRKFAYPILGRDFKAMAYELGTIPLSLAEIILLCMGGCLVLSSFVIFAVYAEEVETRKDILGFFSGTCLLLMALPILHIWEPLSDKSVPPPCGPVAIYLLLSIAGAIFVTAYIFKTGLFLQHSIIPAKTRMVMYATLSFAVLTGSFYFVVGASAYLHFGTFNIGRGMLILSPALCLVAIIIGAIAYARDREQLLEMESNREVRKSRKLRRLEDHTDRNSTVVHQV